MPQRDQIDIFVAGAAHAGKSTVVEIIRKALEAHGMKNIEIVGQSPVNPNLAIPAMADTKLKIIETTYGHDAKPAKEMHLLMVGDKIVKTGENPHG